jgi:hypothetical protein
LARPRSATRARARRPRGCGTRAPPTRRPAQLYFYGNIVFFFASGGVTDMMGWA